MQNAKDADCDAVYCGFHLEGAPGVWYRSNEVSENQIWHDDEVNQFMLDMVASHRSVAKERLYYSLCGTRFTRGLLSRIIILGFYLSGMSHQKIFRFRWIF